MAQNPETVTLMLAGDVMLGRGVDQALPVSSDPTLHEPYVKSALSYLHSAEQASGSIPRPVGYGYVWGDALEHCRRRRPDVRLINLETSVTRSDDWADKGIHYRMHPANISALTAAGVDGCALANNHVLDWGEAGLLETLRTLRSAGIARAGAGSNRDEAEAPAALPTRASGRVLVFSLAAPDCGVLPGQAAGAEKAGIAVLDDLSTTTADRVAARVRACRRPGDIVVVSIHWGGNWGYGVPNDQQAFAGRLVEQGAADVIHGHSSHHAKAIEVRDGKLILYGCGDLINDYEGIAGHEDYGGNLAVLYFAEVQPAYGRLVGLEMIPLEIRRLRLSDAGASGAEWLRARMDRESRRFGGAVELTGGTLALRW